VNFHFLVLVFPTFMSDEDTLKSDESEVNLTAPIILEAVKSYLSDQHFGKKNAPQTSGFIRRLSAKKQDAPSGMETPALDQSVGCHEDHLSMIRGNNQELAYINSLLCDSVPGMLNDALLLAVEERAKRERVEAELELVRERWRRDVSELRDVIAAKTKTISHLIRLNTIPSDTNSDAQLQAALSDIEQLHTIIKSIR
jgi:hypothetical protein